MKSVLRILAMLMLAFTLFYGCASQSAYMTKPMPVDPIGSALRTPRTDMGRVWHLYGEILEMPWVSGSFGEVRTVWFLSDFEDSRAVQSSSRFVDVARLIVDYDYGADDRYRNEFRDAFIALVASGRWVGLSELSDTVVFSDLSPLCVVAIDVWSRDRENSRPQDGHVDVFYAPIREEPGNHWSEFSGVYVAGVFSTYADSRVYLFDPENTKRFLEVCSLVFEHASKEEKE